MRAVAVDTMVLIWGIRAGSKLDPPNKELRRRAKILLESLDEEKQEIIVPTIVVAELLTPVPHEKHIDFISELRRRFICPPFDLQCAALAAEFWQKHRRLAKGQQLKRSTLKADVLIVATASVAGARTFYSSDPRCRSLGVLAGMDSRDLPTHHENLFKDKDLRDKG